MKKAAGVGLESVRETERRKRSISLSQTCVVQAKTGPNWKSVSWCKVVDSGEVTGRPGLGVRACVLCCVLWLTRGTQLEGTCAWFNTVLLLL